MKTPNRKKPDSKRKKKPTAVELAGIQVPENEREVREKEAYIEFVRWSTLTLVERKKEKAPKTQGEFAKKWDVRPATITAWKDRGDFLKVRSEILRKKLAEDVPEVMGDLRTRIKKYGMAMDVELYLAYAEGWDKKKVLEIKPPIEFGENDIRNLISKLPANEQKEFRMTLARLLAKAEAANATLV